MVFVLDVADRNSYIWHILMKCVDLIVLLFCRIRQPWFEVSYDNFFYIKSCYNAFESFLSIDIISCVTCTIIIKIKTNDDVAQVTSAKHKQTLLIIIYIISAKV